MKILYLITKSNFGGAQRYVYDLATALHERGHDIVVAFGGNGPLSLKLIEAGIRTVPIPELERDMNPTNDFRSFLRLLDLISDESPDIVHLNSSKMGGLGALAARLWNIWTRGRNLIGLAGTPTRIIFTGHAWTFNEERPDWQRFLIGCAHWLTIHLSHTTIAVSRKTREQISKLPFVWHKFVVIHNGVKKTKLLSRSLAREKIFGPRSNNWLSEKPLVIGTIAELHTNKGIVHAIDGIAQLKKQSSTPFIYVVIGDGELRTHLEAHVTSLGLNTTVYFAGYIEYAAELLSAFDIFLLPSITEAFPYVILEAGNAGLPVVATAVGGIPEVIDDMRSGILIQSKNPSEITRALAYLIEQPDRRKQFGGAIKEQITGQFNITTMVDETLVVYTRA